MTEIIPAIMPTNINDIREKLALVLGLVDSVQIDLMDGKFVKSMSWPYNGEDEAYYERIIAEEEGLPYWDQFDFEFDLMVAGASAQIPAFTALGAKRLVFHLEAEDNTENAFRDVLEGIDIYTRDNIEIGVSIDTRTPIEKIFPLTPHIDFVQCMGIEHDGFQGEAFDERVLGHIRTLREKYNDLTISVDGAVSLDTAPMLVKAGANRLVVGSAIWKSIDIKETIQELQEL